MKRTNQQTAIRASLITMVVNGLLTAFKMLAGVVGNSTAMIADAIHSFSDMYTTVIVMIGVKLSNRKADRSHPYGHERFECVATLLLASVLVVTGAAIGWAGVWKIVEGEIRDPVIPGGIALVAAVVTLVVKAWMYLYKSRVAKKIDSGALMADATHHLSDALSSVGSFVGILGARMGLPILDPVAAIVICLFIFKAAIDIFRDAIGKMTDKACDEATEDAMREVILAQESVVGIDLLRTRLFGDRIYVELEVSVDGAVSLRDAHDISHLVHDAIEDRFQKVKHCTVHVNPSADGA